MDINYKCMNRWFYETVRPSYQKHVSGYQGLASKVNYSAPCASYKAKISALKYSINQYNYL